MTDELAAGALLGGRYRVVRRIGAGGMGAVYEAVQEGLGRRVAVKVVHPHLVVEAELIERFRREAQAAAALGHANIVQITDFSAEGDTAFLVMEYLAGESLGDVLRRTTQLPPERVAFIAQQVLAALDAAHRAGIVHRDVKPDNVFLTSIAGVTDVVKVLDFGVAKLQGDAVDARLTTTGALMGTPAYMAPEQARGRAVDARTDVYAVGACMYHALCGRVPFETASFNALLFAIAEDPPRPLADLRPDLDPALVAVVERALAKSPASRFASAEDMRAALAPWAQPSAGDAPPPPSATPPDPMAKTKVAPSGGSRPGRTPVVVRSAPPPPIRRVGAYAALAVAALIGGSVAIYRLGEHEGEREREGAAPPSSSSVPVTASAPAPSPAPAAASVAVSSSAPAGASGPSPAAAAPAPARIPSPEAAPPLASTSLPAVVPAAPTHEVATPRRATGGKTAFIGRIDGSALDTDYDAMRAGLQALEGAASACFAPFVYDPTPHEYPDYVVTVGPTGHVSRVAPGAPPRVAGLDACIAGVLSRLNVPTRDGKGGTLLLGFTSRVGK